MIPNSHRVRRRPGTFAALLLLLSLCLPPATGAAAGGVGSRTGLKLPRFASLSAGEVNMRTGPGTRYPVEWVLQLRHMPVEITAEFDTWRRIRDWQGAEGWVHESLLSGRRTAMVRGATATLREAPSADAPAIARVEPKVVGRLLACNDGWCRIEVAGFRGWLPRAALWGILPGEKVE